MPPAYAVITSTRHISPGAFDNLASAVMRTVSRASARAAYAALYGVRFSRSSQQRASERTPLVQRAASNRPAQNRQDLQINDLGGEELLSL